MFDATEQLKALCMEWQPCRGCVVYSSRYEVVDEINGQFISSLILDAAISRDGVNSYWPWMLSWFKEKEFRFRRNGLYRILRTKSLLLVFFVIIFVVAVTAIQARITHVVIDDAQKRCALQGIERIADALQRSNVFLDHDEDPVNESA
jgi:hypothetical protein